MKKHKKYRFIISGGGTGGHIYPAIAIANALKERLSEVEILFVGANGRMEMEKVPKAGYKIVGLNIAGIQRQLTLGNVVKNLMLPFKLIGSYFKAKKIVKTFKPDVAIGVGGYASGPVLRVAEGQNVKCLLQEQNSFAGKTNQWLAKKSAKICVAYEGMEKFFPKDKIIITGNPVRKDIVLTADFQRPSRDFFGLNPAKKTLFVFGGSLGARTINHSVGLALDKFKDSDVQVLWQTGKWFYEEAVKMVKEKELRNVVVKEFVYEMDKAYCAADVVVSRAGALSISELCLVGKPVVLVPSPNVAEDHQTQNALALVNKDAAIMVKDAEAKEKLIDEALKLMADTEKCKTLGQNVLTLGKPDATDQIVEEIIKLADSK